MVIIRPTEAYGWWWGRGFSVTAPQGNKNGSGTPGSSIEPRPRHKGRVEVPLSSEWAPRKEGSRDGCHHQKSPFPQVPELKPYPPGVVYGGGAWEGD